MTGRLLDGRYRIGTRIARGGMASVYQASDIRLDRVVAVKIMHAGLGDDAEFAARFVREARAAAAISHPNVVAVFDQGDDNGTLFLAMEFIRGHTLRDVIRSEAPLSPSRALALFEPVLAALAAAHDAGLIHRDVKPENVLIAEDGRVKVADFGLAKAVSADTQHTATGGVLIGTVSYLAPELVVDGSADPRADVYGAGVVLYELLTGAKPHEGETPIQVAYKHVHDDVPPPSRLVPTLPAYVDALVARATARDRSLRSTDAGVLLHQTRRVAQALGEGVTDDPELVADLMPSASRPQVYVAPDDVSDVDDEAADTGERPATQYDEADDAAENEADDEADHVTTQLGGASQMFAPGAAVGAGAVAAGALAAAPAASVPGDGAADSGLSFSERWRESLAALGHDVEQKPTYPDHEFDVEPHGPDHDDDGDHSALDEPEPDALVADDVYDQERDDPVEAGDGLYQWWNQPPEHTTAIATQPPGTPPFAEGSPPVDPPGGTKQPKPRRSRRGPFLLALALLIAVSAGLAAWWFGFARYTQAPAVIGLQQEKAITLIEDAGLQADITLENYSETVAAGKVISATPDAGARVLGGGIIELVISLGKERYDVPKLAGLTEDKAQDKIAAGNLTFGKSKGAWSEKVAEGRVISQTPLAGKSVRPNAVVDLVISKGRKPIKVKDWTGKSAADAAKALKAKGLKVDDEATDYSTTVPLGFVISQDPQRGTLFKGETVTLVVSLGPELVEIPNNGVIAAGVVDARQTLEDLGFVVRVRRDPTYLGLGYVLRTDPEVGTEAVKGSTVTIYLI